MAIRTNAWLRDCYSKATSIFDVQSSIDAVADHIMCCVLGKTWNFKDLIKLFFLQSLVLVLKAVLTARSILITVYLLNVKLACVCVCKEKNCLAVVCGHRLIQSFNANKESTTKSEKGCVICEKDKQKLRLIAAGGQHFKCVFKVLGVAINL